MMELSFKIPGIPIPRARPRVRRFGHSYYPKRSQDYFNLVKKCLAGQYEGRPLQKPLEVSVEFYMPIPKSKPKYKKQMMENGQIQPTVKTGDIDNLFKAVTDPCIGIVMDDDSQVVQIHCTKHFSYDPRVELCIRTLEGELA